MHLILAILLAAPGDYIYEDTVSVEITGPQAANLAQAFKDVAAWNGTKPDMQKCTVARAGGTVTGFRAECHGEKKSATVPIGKVFVRLDGGDVVYLDSESASITANEAAGMADNFITLNAWDGNRVKMIQCVVRRSGGGFEASCLGTKSAPKASLPEGVLVVGVE